MEDERTGAAGSVDRSDHKSVHHAEDQTMDFTTDSLNR